MGSSYVICKPFLYRAIERRAKPASQRLLRWAIYRLRFHELVGPNVMSVCPDYGGFPFASTSIVAPP